MAASIRYRTGTKVKAVLAEGTSRHVSPARSRTNRVSNFELHWSFQEAHTAQIGGASGSAQPWYLNVLLGT